MKTTVVPHGLLGEVVGERAEEIRRSTRPRLATFEVNASVAEAEAVEQPQARPFRDA